jgi:hypothetical protein
MGSRMISPAGAGREVPLEILERPRRRPDVLTEFYPDGSGLLFDPRQDRAYSLTASAAIIWQTCDGAHTTDAMAEVLVAVYDAPANVIEDDVSAMLEQLFETGLLEPV